MAAMQAQAEVALRVRMAMAGQVEQQVLHWLAQAVVQAMAVLLEPVAEAIRPVRPAVQAHMVREVEREEIIQELQTVLLVTMVVPVAYGRT